MARPKELFTQESMQEVRRLITEANHNEVFLLGRTDEHRRVTKVRLLARGNEMSVSVFQQLAVPGDVVIHNHPSGSLKPSQADIEVSSVFGEFGVGSYIVDNDVTKVYVVVEAFEKRTIARLDASEIGDLLGPDGAISGRLPAYEFRPQQLEMISEVACAFNENRVSIIEAGTGTGKTLAYLLPAVFWALDNRERVVVSTHTINLQEQLTGKDIPLLQKALDRRFKAVLVKGRGNYACLRKVAAVGEDLNFFADEEEVETLKVLTDWAGKSSDGSRSDLNFVPKQEIWEKVSSDSDFCLRAKCPQFKACFVNKARREAAKADILVVNHHLLFADLSLRSEMGTYAALAILPGYKRIVFDEAQDIEDVATSHFGRRVTKLGLLQTLGRLYRVSGRGEKGLLPLLKTKLLAITALSSSDLEDILRVIDGELVPERNRLTLLVDVAFDFIFELARELSGEEEGEIKLRITQRLRDSQGWTELWDAQIDELILSLRRFASSLRALRGKLEDLEADDRLASQIAELRSLAVRTENAAEVLQEVLFENVEGRIQWIEVRANSRRDIVRLQSSPLEIATEMVENVYSRFPTVVLTSATLTTDQKFDFIESRIGLDILEGERYSRLLLPSPFDFKQQAIIGIPLDIPDPGSSGYEREVAHSIHTTLRISGGRAFVLFTSFSMLNIAFDMLDEPLREIGIETLKQGTDNRNSLIERFRRNKTSVLFGTDSFWQGVDVQGDALECVILAKLPFRVPTDPVLEARGEDIRRKGGDPFRDFSVPMAVLKFKQGFGRLIRGKGDRGAVLVFDKRIVEKSYGVSFLRSLPECTTVVGTRHEVFDRLTEFFDSARA